MGLILAIDSSAAQCAAALVSGPQVVAARAEPMAKGQAERLAPLVRELLAEASAAPGDLCGIAVCTGPGNFTGVRIGVAFARGLALSIGCRSVGVPRLQALAAAAGGRVLATAGARRGEIHAQAHDGASALGPLLQGQPETLAPLLAEAAPLRALGPGGEALGRLLGIEAALPGDMPDPATIASLGARILAAGAAPRPAPEYPRPPDAAFPSERPPQILP